MSSTAVINVTHSLVFSFSKVFSTRGGIFCLFDLCCAAIVKKRGEIYTVELSVWVMRRHVCEFVRTGSMTR